MDEIYSSLLWERDVGCPRSMVAARIIADIEARRAREWRQVWEDEEQRRYATNLPEKKS